MDEPPSAEFPNAQFSIGNEFGFRFRSMNETHFVQRRVENSLSPILAIFRVLFKKNKVKKYKKNFY